MLKYKDFKLIKPDINQSHRINKLIKIREGSIFHEESFNKIVQKNFNTEFYFFVDDPVEINNFSPVHVTEQNYLSKCYHFKPLFDIPYAGFLDESKVNLLEINVGLFDSLVYTGFPFYKKTNSNFENLKSGQTSMVDLSLEDDYIFNKIIHSKRRNMIRKAKKSGIEIKKYFTVEGIEQFWPILDKLHLKLGYKNLKRQYYYDLMNGLGGKNKAFILIAQKGNMPISGVFIVGNKNYMIYYKGASVYGVKNEGQGELLQWEAIKLSKSIGTKYYDLCNLDKINLPAIYKFKTGISNNIIHYPKFSKYSIGYKVLNKLSKAH